MLHMLHALQHFAGAGIIVASVAGSATLHVAGARRFHPPFDGFASVRHHAVNSLEPCQLEMGPLKSIFQGGRPHIHPLPSGPHC